MRLTGHIPSDLALSAMQQLVRDVIKTPEKEDMATTKNGKPLDLERVQEWADWMPELLQDIEAGYIDKWLKPLAQAIFKRRDEIDPTWKARVDSQRAKTIAEESGKPVIFASQQNGLKFPPADFSTMSAADIVAATAIEVGAVPDEDGNIDITGKTLADVRAKLQKKWSAMNPDAQGALRTVIELDAGDANLLGVSVKVKGNEGLTLTAIRDNGTLPPQQQALKDQLKDVYRKTHKTARDDIEKHMRSSQVPEHIIDSIIQETREAEFDPMEGEPSIARSVPAPKKRGIVRKKPKLIDDEPTPPPVAKPAYKKPAKPAAASGTGHKIAGGRTRVANVDWGAPYHVFKGLVMQVNYQDDNVRSTTRTVTIPDPKTSKPRHYLHRDLMHKVFKFPAGHQLAGTHGEIVGAKTKCQVAFRSQPGDGDTSYQTAWENHEAVFFPMSVLEDILG